jgi:hypothetical protein
VWGGVEMGCVQPGAVECFCQAPNFLVVLLRPGWLKETLAALRDDCELSGGWPGMATAATLTDGQGSHRKQAIKLDRLCVRAKLVAGLDSWAWGQYSHRGMCTQQQVQDRG